MNLTEEIKNLIITEYKAFKDFMYAGKTKEERDELAQFFTPPEISIKLLEAYNVKDLSGKIVRDPTSGSGNLLAAALIAGADSDKIFGNDYDAAMVKLCRERIRTIPDRLEEIDKEFANSLKAELKEFNDWQIHQGNALQARCLIEFGKEYDTNYNPEYIDDLEYAQSYEHDEEQTFLGETRVYHVNKLSWADENKKAQERLEKKQQLEKRNMQKTTEKAEEAEQVDLFGEFFGGN